MTAAKKKKVTDRESMLTAFMTDSLESGHFPKSEYTFCKDHGIAEADFYKEFGSLESLKKQIWEAFLEQTLHLLGKDEQYQAYGNREKMLTFYFSFFELLTLNRSYVLLALKQEGGSLKNRKQLGAMRTKFLDYAADLVQAGNEEKNSSLTRRSPKLFSEGAWLQLVFLLRFWVQDDSAGFEKTDIAIEKSVNTVFDVFDNTPLDSVLDFGKFLFKETMS